MVRAAALALLAFSLLVGEARAAQDFQVQVVDLRLQNYPGAAVGLLVPGAGPDTSRREALAALVRGKVENSLRGGVPARSPRIQLAGSQERTSGPRILVSLPQDGPQPNDRRYVVVVYGPGYDGLLLSDSTRIPGLVSIVDLAPTALGEGGALRSRPDSDPAATLRDLDARIDGHNDSRLPASLLAGALVLVLALIWPRAGLLGFGAALLANLALGLAEVSSVPLMLATIGLAVAAGGPLLARYLRSDLELGLFLGGVVVAYLATLGVDGSAVALSAFGPSQSARFYGLSNLLETMLLVPALASAVFLFRRFGWIALALVALIAFVAIAGDRFGADGGGAIVAAVGFVVLAALLTRLRGRRLAVALGGALLLAAGLVALDAATGPSSHVTRALDSGPGGLAADLRDRVHLSWERVAQQTSAAVVAAVCLTALVLLVVQVLRSHAPLERRALPLALAAAVAVSLVVNDTPNDVLAAGLVGYVALEVVMLRGRCAALLPSPGSSSRSRSSLPAAAPRRP
jgi:hypothetical protein